jgi:hypothetical protein
MDDTTDGIRMAVKDAVTIATGTIVMTVMIVTIGETVEVTITMVDIIAAEMGADTHETVGRLRLAYTWFV